MTNVGTALSGWAHHAKKNAGWLVALGVLTVIAGFLSIAAPHISGLSVTVMVGGAMLVAGIARTVGAFQAGSFGQGALAFIGGLLTLAAGMMLVVRPGIGLASLTLLLGCCLLVDGIAGAVLALRVRPVQGWGWILFNAVMAVLLGGLLLWEWPLSGLWAIGTLVGISLLSAGFSIISIGSAARRVVTQMP